MTYMSLKEAQEGTKRRELINTNLKISQEEVISHQKDVELKKNIYVKGEKYNMRQKIGNKNSQNQ